MEKKENILPLFDFTVPLNDKMLLKASKKGGKVAGILSMLASAIFAGLAIFSATAKNSSVWVVVLFGAFFVLSVTFGVFSFTKGKNNPKDNDLAYKYKFYEECLCVERNSRKNKQLFKIEKVCVYRQYKNKQFVAKVIEVEEGFILKIYTGTYNFVPQYKDYQLPKTSFEDVELMEIFKKYMSQTFGKDYIKRQN